MGAFTKLFSRLRITSDPNVSTQTSAVITADSGNTNLVIAPSGTGALVAQIPDGTATGGNARGANSVDLQMVRSDEADVAGGDYSVVLGGQRNRTSIGPYNAVVGGYFNQIVGSSQSGVIAGGNSNTINASNTTISGGRSNVVSSQYSTISGGQSNTASTNTHATVVGGQSNTSSGQHSVSGGFGNVASGYGTIVIGNSATSSGYTGVAIGPNASAAGTRSVAIGAYSTCTGGDNSIAFAGGQVVNGYTGSAAFGESKTTSESGFSFGKDSLSYLRNQFAQSPINIYGGNTLYYGYSQASQVVAVRQATLTTGATTVLSLDGTGTTNLIIPNGNNRMWNVTIKYVAVVTTITGTATGVTVGDTKSQNIEIGFKKVGGASSLVGGGSFSIPQENASMGSASLIPTAGGSQELALTFTAPTFSGGGSVTCRVVAKVELVEVAY